MDRVYIISNYDYDPTEVIECLNSDYLLCQQGDAAKVPEKFKKLDNYIRTAHTGHNISDYLKYIIDNYDSLPEELGFIKGNIFPRHIEKKIFKQRIKEEGFIPLYSDQKTYSPVFGKEKRIFKKYIAQQIAPGIYLEISNDWYTSLKPKGEFYPTLKSLFTKITNRQLPEYITMVPGACMIVPKHNILKWSKDFYEELYKIVTYQFFPVEAYHVERCMMYIFHYQKQ